jgi:PleD family two-component response regulator
MGKLWTRVPNGQHAKASFLPLQCKSTGVMTTILVADDHEIVRSGLRALLNVREDWQVVTEAADGREAVAQAVATAPDMSTTQCPSQWR